MKENTDVLKKLTEVASATDGIIRRSRKGVPHIVIGRQGNYGSICYFKSTDIWKFFYPYPSGTSSQTKKTFTNVEELLEFVSEKEWTLHNWRNYKFGEGE